MAFATATDISDRLGRALTQAEAAQVAALIADATAHLQAVIGQRVASDTTTIRHRAPWHDLRVKLVQFPIRSVDTVKLNDVTLVPVRDWSWYGDDTVYVITGYTVTTAKFANLDVTYTHGLAETPHDLKQITCALVLQTLGQLQRSGAMDPGQIQSERIDDYSVSYQVGSGSLGMHVPPAVAERLRAKYGQGAYVTGAS